MNWFWSGRNAGEPGTAGFKDDQGPKGSKGYTGATGIIAPPRISAKSDSPREHGPVGVCGSTGPPGPRGPRGIPGE